MNDPAPRTAAPLRRRIVPLVISAAWIAFLVVLAAKTANPVTLNLQQLKIAAAMGMVATATVTDQATGRCKVDQVLAKGAAAPAEDLSGKEIFVRNLTAERARTGEAIILPLETIGENQYEIVPTRVGIPAVYPATAALIAEVKNQIAPQR